MLWLCLHFPQLPLSALGLPHAGSAVVDQRGSQRWLITGTPDCAAGTPLARALSLYPDLKMQVRRPGAEQEALRSLAYWIYRFGQPVTAQIQDLAEPGRSPRALLWVEVGNSLALFGGLEALRKALCSELLELGHAAQIGIAPTRSGAALLACTNSPDAVMDLDGLSACLASLPISSLHWPSDLLQALSGVGFRKLAALFAVPRDAFSKRFGAAYRLELDRLLGHAPERTGRSHRSTGNLPPPLRAQRGSGGDRAPAVPVEAAVQRTAGLPACTRPRPARRDPGGDARRRTRDPHPRAVRRSAS